MDIEQQNGNPNFITTTMNDKSTTNITLPPPPDFVVKQKDVYDNNNNNISKDLTRNNEREQTDRTALTSEDASTAFDTNIDSEYEKWKRGATESNNNNNNNNNADSEYEKWKRGSNNNDNNNNNMTLNDDMEEEYGYEDCKPDRRRNSGTHVKGRRRSSSSTKSESNCCYDIISCCFPSYWAAQQERRRSSRMNKNPLLSDHYNHREYKFVIAAGILLAFNAGYINGSCLSGLLTPTGRNQSVAGFTGYYTNSALYLADGQYMNFSVGVRMVLSFMFGSFLAGLINPHVKAHSIAPTYCPTFIIGAIFLIIASILAAIHEHGDLFFYFAAAANGIQNGMSSLYSANLIRSTHFTGTTTDIGLFFGQVIRGNYKNLWKLQVLVGLTIAFWFGGFVSFYSTHRFTSLSLLFNAGLFLAIGVGLLLSLSSNIEHSVLSRWKSSAVMQF